MIFNAGIVADDDPLCRREILPTAVFGAFFKNGYTETHRMEQRCQRLGAVTAAENDCPLANEKGQTEHILAADWLPAFRCGSAGNGMTQNHSAV